jgi:hypothetical protein
MNVVKRLKKFTYKYIGTGIAIWNGLHLLTKGDTAQEWLQYASSEIRTQNIVI